jgi:hypothetical protein
MDGTVVKAAVKALDTGKVSEILAFVPKDGEAEVQGAFDEASMARREGPHAKEVAERYFFETAVRVHCAGEGAPYTGLKPAGLDHGPVIPVADRALETGSADDLVALLTAVVEAEIRQRLAHAMARKPMAERGVDEAREYVEAMLGLQVWANQLYQCAKRDPHERGHEHAD